MSSQLTFESKIQKNRKLTEALADDISRLSGSFVFLVLNILFFAFWLLLNTGQLPGLPIIDPFPFIFLTMIVSLEAICLSIVVLISQNRQSVIASIREEIHLQINQIAEREITKCLKLIADIHASHFPDSSPDPELLRMLKKTDTGKLEAQIEKELEPQPLVISEFLEKLEEKIPISQRKK